MDNRYYCSSFEGNKFYITDQEAQHLIKVRRCKVGDEIVAFVGDGIDYHLEITEIKKDSVVAKLRSKNVNLAFNEKEIAVFLAMIKNDALIEAVDHLAELNVKKFYLYKADFSVAEIDEKKLNKLTQVAIQASKQSERADIMQFEIIDKKDIERISKQYDNVFFAYENANEKIKSFNGNFAVIIGPEGGFSPTEAEEFSKFASTISLGKTILRAEVAGVTAVTMLKVAQNEG